METQKCSGRIFVRSGRALVFIALLAGVDLFSLQLHHRTPAAEARVAPPPTVQGLPNLTIVKEKLIAYHDCKCDCGCYTEDLARVGSQALAYLKRFLAESPRRGGQSQPPRKPAIVIDIDETAISNWENLRKMDFGYSHDEFTRWEGEAKAPAIQPTLTLYQFAHDHQVSTFFITGRSEAEREFTIKDLENAGYKDWTGLIMRRPGPRLAAEFKSAERKKLHEAGYLIVINIGDQASDLAGEPALKSFKIPNPFYYIP